MASLKEKLREKIELHRPRTQRLLRDYGDVVVDHVTIAQIIGGMRGLKSLVTDISYLDPNEGIRYRGYTLPEVFEKLPKPKGAEMPYVEGLVYLLLTGDIPTEAEVSDVVDDFRKRRINFRNRIKSRGFNLKKFLYFGIILDITTKEIIIIGRWLSNHFLNKFLL